MILQFRHGILSSQAAPFLYYNSSGNIDLLAANKPLTVTVAHKNSDYLHSEDNTVLDAWKGNFLATQNYYLYLEFDTKTMARTFGYTTEAPKFQAGTPAAPTDQTTWFNTATNEQFRWIGSSFSKVFRVFIAKLNNRKFTSLSANNPSFYGTQIGNNKSARAGRIMYTEYGKPIRRDSGTFVTTEDQFFTNQSQVIGVRLESNITIAKASESLAAYQVVAVDIDGNLRTAQYGDVEDKIIAVVTENLLTNETGNIIVQGTITNPDWDFSGLPAGTKLYVNNGELVRTDPHTVNPVINRKPQVPVAKVLSIDSIIFEQGLGGVGPAGEGVVSTGPVSIDNLPPANKNILGGVYLATSPEDENTPIAVGTNDPRFNGAPFSSKTHTHSADEVSVTTIEGDSLPFGTMNTPEDGNAVGTDVQDVLSEILSKKANNKPVYDTENDLPDATDSRGMLTHVLSDNSVRFASESEEIIKWNPLSINDGTIQDHIHTVNYNLNFFSGGLIASEANAIICRILIPRAMTWDTNAKMFARVVTPPDTPVTFNVFVNGIQTSIVITFDPAVNDGLVSTQTTIGITTSYEFEEGDYVDIVSPSTTESTISDLAVSFVGTGDTKLH